MSPNQSAKMSDTTLSPGSTKGSMPSVKMQTLRQRKTDLDNLLTEKNNLLQQFCREEAKLLASCSAVGSDLGMGIDCSDGHSMNAVLRRRIDTSFKLPENLLNSKEDEINKYLLSKQIQQQISEASLKLANDMSQTKVSVIDSVSVHGNYKFIQLFIFSRFAEHIDKITRPPSTS